MTSGPQPPVPEHASLQPKNEVLLPSERDSTTSMPVSYVYVQVAPAPGADVHVVGAPLDGVAVTELALDTPRSFATTVRLYCLTKLAVTVFAASIVTVQVVPKHPAADHPSNR